MTSGWEMFFQMCSGAYSSVHLSVKNRYRMASSSTGKKSKVPFLGVSHSGLITEMGYRAMTMFMLI